MKDYVYSGARICALVLSTFLVGSLRADEIKTGDSVDRVIEVLGAPRARARSGRTEIISYARGSVTFSDGKVTAFDLTSPEEAAQRETERLQREARRRAASAAARAQRIREGTAKKAEQIANANFTNLTAEAQLEYWVSFRRDYPEVAVSAEIASLEETIRNAAREKREARQKVLADEIRETEEAIDTLANRRGVGRRAFVDGFHELKRLRQKLEDLRQEKAKLP